MTPRYLALLLFVFFAFALNGQGPGSLDPNFGNNGKVQFDFDQVEHCSKILCDTSGNIYLSGHTTNYDSGVNQDYFILKLSVNGSLDTSFGNLGIIRGDFGNNFNSRIVDMDLGNNAIFFIGEANNAITDTQDIFIGKIDLNGNFSSSFGNNGLVSADYVWEYDAAGAIRALPDGRILYCGMTLDTSVWHIELPLMGRLLADGSPDSSFGGSGSRTWSLSNGLQSSKALHIDGGRLEAILPIGNNYLFAGFFFTSSYSKGMLIMLDEQGDLVSGFGQAGLTFPSLGAGTHSGIMALASQDDKVIMASQAISIAGNSDMALLEMDSLGANLSFEPIDLSGNEDQIQGLLVDSQGQIISAGFSKYPGNSTPGYESDGFAIDVRNNLQSPVNYFANQGQLIYDPNPGEECGATTLCETSDGSLLVAGYINDTSIGNYVDLMVIKVNNDPSTGISRSQPENRRRVYPNPANRRIYISGDVQGQVWVRDIHGRKVMETDYNNTGIDISELAPGVYFLITRGFQSKFVVSR